MEFTHSLLTIDDKSFWTWLAGFSDGEACFSLHHTGGSGTAYATEYRLGLRADDWQILRALYERTKLGRLYGRKARATGGGKAQLVWAVMGITNCRLLRDGLLRGSGLQAKKARDFELWSEAIDLISLYGGGKYSAAGNRLAELKVALHATKIFANENAEGHLDVTGLGFVNGRDPNPIRAKRTALIRAKSAKNFWASSAAVDAKLFRQRKYARLSQEEVDEIVRRSLLGERRQALATEFAVSYSMIGILVRGERSRRDGTLAPLDAHVGPKSNTPEFWNSEAGQRAKASNASIRGKLTQVQIDELVARAAAGETAPRLAIEYGISKPLAYKFIKGNYVRRG